MGGGFCNRMLFSQHPWCLIYMPNCTKDPWLPKFPNIKSMEDVWAAAVSTPDSEAEKVSFSKEIEVPKSGSKSVGK